MQKKTTTCLILNTCPDRRTAQRIAKTLVSESLAACVNVMPSSQSIYRWKGKIESTREVLLIIKARSADYKRIETRLLALHPYELPEIIRLNITGGYAPYLAWIERTDKP